jgi:hypothetical protein
MTYIYSRIINKYTIARSRRAQQQQALLIINVNSLLLCPLGGNIPNNSSYLPNILLRNIRCPFSMHRQTNNKNENLNQDFLCIYTLNARVV